MASGTDGEILTYDASGNPTSVSVGTDGQVLTSTGVGSPPAFETAAGGNAPYFSAYRATSQTLSDAVTTKIQLNNEQADSDSAYDNSTNYRFTVPSGKAGKYLFGWGGSCYSGSASINMRNMYFYLYKNGSQSFSTLAGGGYSSGANEPSTSSQVIMDLAVSDYIEIYVNADSNGATPRVDNAFFTGIKVG
jgi:hypothetical protein